MLFETVIDAAMVHDHVALTPECGDGPTGSTVIDDGDSLPADVRGALHGSTPPVTVDEYTYSVVGVTVLTVTVSPPGVSLEHERWVDDVHGADVLESNGTRYAVETTRTVVSIGSLSVRYSAPIVTVFAVLSAIALYLGIRE